MHKSLVWFFLNLFNLVFMQLSHQFIHAFIIEKRSAFHRDQFSVVSIFHYFSSRVPNLTDQ